MTTWRNFDQRQVLGRSGEFRGSLSGLSPVRAPGAVVPKREKEEAVVEKRLGVDCGSPGKICPITVSESISFLFCDGDRLPASWIWQARRILFGFCKRRTSCLLLQPPWCGRRWQQSRRRGLTTPTPPPRPIEPWHNRCRGCIHQLHSFRRRHGMDACCDSLDRHLGDDNIFILIFLFWP